MKQTYRWFLPKNKQPVVYRKTTTSWNLPSGIPQIIDKTPIVTSLQQLPCYYHTCQNKIPCHFTLSHCVSQLTGTVIELHHGYSVIIFCTRDRMGHTGY